MTSPLLAANRVVVSVSDINKSARRLIEGEFPLVYVEGEISNFAAPASGHWYLTLKDSKAQLRCAMFKGNNKKLRFVPRNGMQVILRGRLSLYEGRGEFQMIGESMEEAGDGALRRAFEKLKAQLHQEGLFEPENKSPLPTMPQHLAIITSPTGAAVRDVLHILKRRFPALRASIIPVQVQGDVSSQQIAAALAFANRYEDSPFDLILLTRGGGSLEDLWSFNTEPVARAIAASQIPVVSGVGHETDTTIADYVADLRAPTPSAAAELISPDAQLWIEQTRQIEQVLTKAVERIQINKAANLHHLKMRLRHPGQRIQDWHQRLDDLEARFSINLKHRLERLNFDHINFRLQTAMQQNLSTHTSKLKLLAQRQKSPLADIQLNQQKLKQLQQQLIYRSDARLKQAKHDFQATSLKLDAVSPLKILQRGYAIVTDENQNLISDSHQLKVGDKITTRLNKGEFKARIESVKPV